MNVESIVFKDGKTIITYVFEDGKHCQTEFYGEDSSSIRDFILNTVKLMEKVNSHHACSTVY